MAADEYEEEEEEEEDDDDDDDARYNDRTWPPLPQGVPPRASESSYTPSMPLAKS